MKYALLRLLPLLLIYLVLITLLSSPSFQADEASFYNFAGQLARGSYAYPARLWWGPGYPIVLIPFFVLDLPLLAPRLLNAFLLFGTVFYFFQAVSFYVDRRAALILAFCLGLYPPFLRDIHLIKTETLAYFLVGGLLFHFCRAHRQVTGSRGHLLAASLYLAWLALTKVFFGYVLAAGLLLSLLVFVWRRGAWAKTAAVYGLALAWCLPYLLLTSSLTGKAFYWGASGGMSLYWLSAPYDNDLGSWFSPEEVASIPGLAPHRPFFDRIVGLSEVEMDDVFKTQAMDNIVHHPLKFGLNWLANVGRLLFSYPFSFAPQKLSTYFYLLPNMFLVVLFVFGVYPAVVGRAAIPHELGALLLFALLALGGTSLVSAYDRQFRPLVPILGVWLAFVYLCVLRIEIRRKDCSPPAQPA